MSSIALAMPSVSVTKRPRRRLSGSESFSGISTANTLSRPSARAHSATVTLESMPPDKPSTTPRLRSRRSTCARIAAVISSVAAAASRRSASAENAMRRSITSLMRPAPECRPRSAGG